MNRMLITHVAAALFIYGWQASHPIQIKRFLKGDGEILTGCLAAAAAAATAAGFIMLKRVRWESCNYIP